MVTVDVDNIYVRFRFAPGKLPQTVLPMIFRLGGRFGLNPALGLRDPEDPGKGKKFVIVEFSSRMLRFEM